MADSTDPPIPDSLSLAQDRNRLLLHTLGQIVAIILIFVMVNYLSCRHYARWDATKNNLFTLSTVSTNFLKSLSTDVDVIVAFLPSSPIYSDVRNLAEEYQRQGNKHINMEMLDPARNPSRAQEVKEKYGLNLTRSSIVVAHGSRYRIIRESDMAQYSSNGQIVTNFMGEIAITAAMIGVVEERAKQVYLVVGYHTAEFLQVIFDDLRNMSARYNAKVDYLELSGGRPIPDDADAIVLAAPQRDPAPEEMKAILDYWKRPRGAIFLSLDPDAETPSLDALVRQNGVSPRDDRLVYASQVIGESLQKDYRVPVTIREGTVITSDLAGYIMELGGRSQSLELFEDSDLVRLEQIHLSKLLVADVRFWGETEYDALEPRRDRDKDNFPPLYVGVAIERGAADDPNLRVETQRMVVVSNPTILQGGLERTKVRSDFSMACLNWLLDRTELIGVSAKEPTRYAVAMQASQASTIEFLVIWFLPALVGLFGLTVWYLRRS